MAKTVRLVNARTWEPGNSGIGYDDVPVLPEQTGGKGVSAYLEKRSPDGKRVFYFPEEWEAYSPEKRESLRIKPAANGAAVQVRVKSSAFDKMLQGAASLSVAEREQMLRALGVEPKPELEAKPAPVAPKGK